MRIKETLFNISVLTATFCASVLLLLIAVIADIPYPWSLLLLIPSVLLAAYERPIIAVASAKKLEFDENILIPVAMILLFVSGHGSGAAFSAAILRAAFIAQKVLVSNAQKQRSKLLPPVSETAWIALDDGTYKEIPADELTIGTVVLARPYEDEFLPADGIVVKGEGKVSSSFLNGSAASSSASVGSVLYSGMQSIENPLHVKITALPKDSAAAEIRTAMTRSDNDCDTLKLSRTFCRFAAPVAFSAALLFCVISTLVFKFGILSALYVSGAALLCVSPASLFSAQSMGLLSAQSDGIKNGVIFKNRKSLECVASADAVIFDGAENLFTFDPVIDEIIDPNGMGKENVMLLFAALLQNSTLPEARAIRAGVTGVHLPNLDREVEKKGLGVAAELDGKRFLCGKKELFDYVEIPTDEMDADIYLSIGKKLYGGIKIKADPLDLTHTSIGKIASDFTEDIFVTAKDDKEVGEYRLDELVGCNLKILPSENEKADFLRQLSEDHTNIILISDDENIPDDLPVTRIVPDFERGIGQENADIITQTRDSDGIFSLMSYARRRMSLLRISAWSTADLAVLLFGFAIFGHLPAAIGAAVSVGAAIASLVSLSGLVKIK